MTFAWLFCSHSAVNRPEGSRKRPMSAKIAFAIKTAWLRPPVVLVPMQVHKRTELTVLFAEGYKHMASGLRHIRDTSGELLRFASTGCFNACSAFSPMRQRLL